MKKQIYTTATILYIGTLLFLLLSTRIGSLSQISNSDKVLHAFSFFLLSALLYLTLNEYKMKYPLIITSVFVLCFTFATEILQRTFGRTFSYFDMISDIFGLFCAIILILLFRRKK